MGAEEVELSEIVADWAEGWMRRKEKMKRRIMKKKEKWKAKAASKQAEEAWKKAVEEAAKEMRRAKAVEQVSPDEWARAAAMGIDEKTITDVDRMKFAKKAGKYIALVMWAKEEFDKITFPDSKTKMDAWYNIVSTRLRKAKSRPDLIPKIKEEIRAELEKLKSQYGAISVPTATY